LEFPLELRLVGNVIADEYSGEHLRPCMLDTLVEVIDEVKERCKTAALISLFLDFDGTLVPIEAHPDMPRLDPVMKETLELLAAQDSLVTTIISGRAIQDLYPRIDVKGLIYAGNHGQEIFGRNLRFVEPGALARREQLEVLCGELRMELQSVDGVLVEFKGLTASVHYRQAAETRRPEIHDAVLTAVARAGGLFRMNQGRKVYEIVPRTAWHKGAAVHWVNDHIGGHGTLTVYLGDDVTDEDAFSVLPEAITIKVGGLPVTAARYRLPDPTAVHEFLLWLATRDSSRQDGA
jgi:trehalose-phosphatase